MANRSRTGAPQRSAPRTANDTRTTVRTGRSRRVIIFENTHSANHTSASVEKFAQGLRKAGLTVEIRAPKTAHDMVIAASDARKEKPWALIAAGGDGAVNLVARTLVGSPIFLGILPLGLCNNIFRSLTGEPNVARALEVVLGGEASAMDCGKVAGQPFFGSIGLGLFPSMTEELTGRSLPKLGLSWSRVASRAAANVKRERIGIKLDSIKFDASPTTLSVHLLSHTVGLPVAPSALWNDQKFEVIIDSDTSTEPFSKYIRALSKGNYIYQDDLRLYRAQEISLGPVKGRTLYLDGELIEIPVNAIDVTFYPVKLHALCASRKIGHAS